jgi:hypothetical protein
VTAAYGGAPVYHSTFDKANRDFTVVRGSAAIDGAVTREGNKSVRVERGGTEQDAAVRCAPVTLTIGQRYEVSGYVRTEGVEVRDLDRSPIATGAMIAMESMPYDVHSESVAGTRGWTHLSLRFVATRAQDAVLLTVGAGGSFRGKAWFEGLNVEEAAAGGDWPIQESVKRFGPAYRYPAAGWIYLHIEGGPYERGYQHGHLMAKEIPEYLDRCASDLGSAGEWDSYRTTANALFLRGFSQEILEEMRGIAEGASDAGAQWRGRRVDLLDIVVANVTVEMGELRSALSVTPTGLESFTFDKPAYVDAGRDRPVDHCSAFAATGPATRDGKMTIGHVTWWPLALAEQTNVMIDIQPASGHRVMMQSYPGGIESGTDWYQNDAGMVLTETTINQTPFNAQGTPVAFRAREAIQYGGSVDEVVARLGERNNGLYTNEWLIGDAKNNEIAMYELGTNHTKLWRSSKNEWFGDTPGFYWGDNNAKDLAVRLEDYPSPNSPPSYIPYVPSVRDLAWQELYRKNRGQIDEQFGFTAFRTAPLVSASTMDAKVTNTEMASRMMVWAAIGKPNQREWTPAPSGYAKNDGLYPSGYYMFWARRGMETEAAPAATAETARRTPSAPLDSSRLWNGWLLPASPADTWFVAGSAAYRQTLASGDVDRAMAGRKAAYRGFALGPQNEATQEQLESLKGVLFLDGLRRKMGDDAFLQLMSDYFKANAGKTVTADSFLKQAGTAFDFEKPGEGPAYLTSDINRRLATAAIVYGTVREAGANRYAAEQMQSRFLDQLEHRVPVYKDFEAPDDVLSHADVIFIGRPETNSALAAWTKQLGLEYQGAAFQIDGAWHASEREALVLAAKNPLDASHMALVVAGNDALRTVKAIRAEGPSEYVLYTEGEPPAAGYIGMGTASGPGGGGRGGRGRR